MHSGVFSLGKIILIPFPFTDLSGVKVRPAVIISNKSIGDDILVAFISTNTKKKSHFEIVVKMNNQNGLKSDSTVVVSKIATLEKKTVLGEIGKLSKSEILQVKKKLKDLFF
ncbi:MAG TPA: type II toxin-antitoxin system PemK/MazF family toxin [Candidatus Paceibacterota bacterium]|nr:hypothetical protein [uncultured archaeon]